MKIHVCVRKYMDFEHAFKYNDDSVWVHGCIYMYVSLGEDDITRCSYCIGSQNETFIGKNHQMMATIIKLS